ncbi:hypothetical protein N300_07772, partial [Calypte anna]
AAPPLAQCSSKNSCEKSPGLFPTPRGAERGKEPSQRGLFKAHTHTDTNFSSPLPQPRPHYGPGSIKPSPCPDGG